MSTRMDNAANDVIKAATECRFRETDEMCPRCQRDLEVYYCENRTFAVRCKHCEMVTIVQASNPHEAAEKVGLHGRFKWHGKWERNKDDVFWGNHFVHVECSVCKREAHMSRFGTGYVKSNYCPNCGAKMDLEG